MHDRRRIAIPIIILVILGSLGAWLWMRGTDAGAAGALDASGTVEAVEVSIASEISGRVVEVMVKQGRSVEAGEVLLRLDGTLLQTQRRRAETGLLAAQENLSTAQVGLSAAEAAHRAARVGLEVAQANAGAELVIARQALDALYENTGLARAEAVRRVASANRALRDAEYNWENYTIPSSQEDMTAIEAISVTWDKLEAARRAFEPFRNEDSGNDRREELADEMAEAQSDYDTAVRRMELETAVEQARQALEKATRDLESLQDGPDPDDVAELEARIAAIEAAPKAAEAALEQAAVGIEQAQARLKSAEAALEQASAELTLIDVQIEKLTVVAPLTGTVITRNVEPGEVVQAGATLMTIGELNSLEITVYVAEDRYGQIELGQKAYVMVDSFPGQSFSAVVTHIADRAEFTPRNVQTTEGRKTTVFAVKLAIENPDGRLKPGMPADVSFEKRTGDEG